MSAADKAKQIAKGALVAGEMAAAVAGTTLGAPANQQQNDLSNHAQTSAQQQVDKTSRDLKNATRMKGDGLKDTSRQ